MRMAALVEVLKQDSALKSVYLIGQDYSFGQAVLREAKRQLALQRPDVQIVGDELHPIGRVKDFAPYAIKIKSSGAQAVITGNWGNDLTLLVKAAKDVGFTGTFYTFYGNALGAPAAIGDAGVGKLIAVADWFPNYSNPKNPEASEIFMKSFRARYPKPADDYVHMRMQLMIDALAQAINTAGASDALAIASVLEKVKVTFAGQSGEMRASDHQFQQSLMVGVMGRKGDTGVKFDVEGSGYGFKVVRSLTSYQAALPSSCKMVRP
jgi:branched-chain amino acid transport system substrate-binding protein